MSWDDLADDAAVRHHTFESMTGEDNERIRYGFWNGAKWQRDQLRTDEAVENLARFLYEDERQETFEEHESWCHAPECEARLSYSKHARAVITALLGDD